MNVLAVGVASKFLRAPYATIFVANVDGKAHYAFKARGADEDGPNDAQYCVVLHPAAHGYKGPGLVVYSNWAHDAPVRLLAEASFVVGNGVEDSPQVGDFIALGEHNYLRIGDNNGHTHVDLASGQLIKQLPTNNQPYFTSRTWAVQIPDTSHAHSRFVSWP